jgi:7-carboxy-7-deazaguanine synthase
MVFVRTHGCDYSCSFCDTKDSWKPGSPSRDAEVLDLADEISALKIKHVSITGGNPLIQPEALHYLLGLLNARGHTCLVETQASVYHEACFSNMGVVSLSPKLHDWRWEPLMEILANVKRRVLMGEGVVSQIKVVTQKSDAVRALEAFQRIHDWWGSYGGEPHYILLPEYSLGRQNVQAALDALNEWKETHGGEFKMGYTVRIIPQLHKLTMFVP